MKVFVAGSTGAVGKSLLPLLVEKKHEVVALVRSSKKVNEAEAMGARAVIGDVFNKEELTEIIKKTEPEIIIHQLTALAGVSGNFRKFDKEFALTNRLRTEVTDTLLNAAAITGARRFIAQSFCGWPYAREGGPVKTESDPLDPDPPASFRKTLSAILYLERAVKESKKVEAIALRYGMLYGRGTGISKDGVIVELLRKHKIPVVGNGEGIWSFTYIGDAAFASVLAMTNGTPGIYNVVDDEPAQVSAWLPYLAEVLGAKPPQRIPVWLARLLIGEGGVSMMTKIRGASNVKAKRELNWKPIYSSWRQGFAEAL